MAGNAPAFTFDDVIQLVEGLESGGLGKPELLGCAIRIGRILDQAMVKSDAFFDTFSRFMGRIAQAILGPALPGYPFVADARDALLNVLSSLLQLALHVLRSRDNRFSVLAWHVIRMMTDRAASVYSLDQRMVVEAQCESIPLPPQHWTTQLRRNSFCHWLDPEGTVQAVKVLSFSHHRATMEIQSQRFGNLVTEKSIPMMSRYLSPISQLPESVEKWRTDLVIGSRVDCIDHVSKWYTASVIGQNVDGLLHIAYDNWTATYNEWLPRTSGRIAPHFSIAVGGRPSSGVEMLYPEEWLINSSKDTNETCAVYRSPMMGGDLLPMVINVLADSDGLSFLLSRINAEPHPSLEEVRSFAFILRQIAPLLSEEFAQNFVHEASQALFNTILDLTDVELRGLTKEFLSEFVTIIRTPLLRIRAKSDVSRVLDEFELNMAVKRVRCPIVERQLNGMEFLYDTMHICKSRDIYSRPSRSGGDCGWAAYRWQWLDSSAFIQWMDSNGVWEDAFGDHAHAQLMKRASELLRFICREGKLTDTHLDLIWTAIQRATRWQDETMTQILYTVLDEISPDLSEEHVAHLLRRVKAVDFSDYVVHTLDMIRRLHRGDLVALDLIWDAMQAGSSELSREARLRLELMLHIVPSSGDVKICSPVPEKGYTHDCLMRNRTRFLSRAGRKIQDHSCILQNMSLAENILKSLGAAHFSESVSSALPSVGSFFSSLITPSHTDPELNGQPPIHCSRSEAINWLDVHCDLMKSVFDELVAFMEVSIRSNTDSGGSELTDISAEQGDFQNSGCSFIENIRRRLAFLRFILRESNLHLANAHIDILWDIIFQKSIFQRQSDVILNWFQEILDDGATVSSHTEFKCIGHQAVLHLFTTKLCSLSPCSLTEAAYACIERYFLIVNSSSGKLTSRPYQIIAFDLVGIDFIWGILLEAADSRVSCCTVILLNQIYSGHRLEYISNIMRRMTVLIDASDYPRIRRLLRLLSRLLRDAGSLSSMSSNHGRLRQNLDDSNSTLMFRVTCSGISPFITTQSACSTVRCLRNELASKFNVACNDVRMFLHGAELFDIQILGDVCSAHCATSESLTPRRKRQRRLGHTGVPSRACIHIMMVFRNKPPGERPVARSLPLLAGNQLTESAQESVSKIFSIFTENSDTMSLAQLKRFISASTVAKSMYPDCVFDPEAFLSKYVNQLNGTKSLTSPAFSQFYTLAACQFPQIMSQELSRLCSPQNAALVKSISSPNVIIELSPKDILSSSDEYFSIFFRALQLGDSRISGQVWRLLMAIPTNPSLKRKISELPTPHSIPADASEPLQRHRHIPDWPALFDSSSAFLLMYSLQIIQDLICRGDWTEMDVDVMTSLFDCSTDDEGEANGDCDDSASSSSKSSMNGTNQPTTSVSNKDESTEGISLPEGSPWSVAFVNTGGFEHLYNLLLHAEILRQDDDCSLFCLALLLKSIFALLTNSVSLQDKTVSSPINGLRHCPPNLPWFRFDQLHSRILEILSQVATGNRIKSSWPATCVVYFALPLWRWLVDLAPDVILPLLCTDEVMSLLHRALTGNVRAVREQVQSTLYSACQVHNSLHSYVLDYLLSLLHQVEESPSGQFFNLLKKLLVERFSSSRLDPSSYDSLVVRFVTALKSHRSIEAPSTLSSVVSDELLLGIIEILTVLCSADSKLCESAGDAGAVELLLHKCLFGIGPPDFPKCRSVQTRKGAFSCVYLLCSNSQQNLGKAIRCLTEICSSPTREIADEACVRRGWDYEPEKIVRGPSGYTGLVNQGTTCYMNALVSQLFMIPRLRRGLIEASSSHEPPASEAIKQHRVLFAQLQNMLANMVMSSCAAYDTSSFCGAYTDEAGIPIDVRVQQDAQEFFNVLVDRVELALKGSDHETLLKNIFGGRLCNQMLCQGGCGSIRERYEDFSNVSLQVKGFKTLSESLEAYVASEKLNGVDCDACGARTDTTLKRVVLDNLPQTLIFHLKRFELNFETFMNEKLNNRFEFPLKVNMEPYTKTALTPDMKSSGPLEYELRGVIIHIGTADAGHYFSYIRDRSAAGNIWFEFNDQVVRRFSIEKLGEEAFGGDDNMKNAYMLVYEKTETSNDNVDSDTECIIPPAMANEISSHNNMFFRDRELFDPASIVFIKEIIALPTREHEQASLKLFVTFSLEVAARTASGYGECCSALSTLRSHVFADVDLAIWFLREFATRPVLLADFLLTCRDKNIRESFSDVLSFCLEKVSAHDTPHMPSDSPPPPYSEFEYETQFAENEHIFGQNAVPRTLCQEIVASLLTLVDSASRHWLRFHQLFAILLRWASSGAYARHFLVSQSAVARLGHLILGRDTLLHHYPKHNTVMGNRAVQPDLHTVYQIMGVLVRGCYGNNHCRPATSLPGPLSTLSNEDLQVINFEMFYERALATGGDVQGVVDILTHRSWENVSHLAPVNKMIIDGIVKATTEQVQPYFDLFHGIVQIADSLQTRRIQELMSVENGILCHMRSFSSGHAAFTATSIRLLLRSVEVCPPLASHFSSLRHHCDWMIPWMERYIEQHSYHIDNGLVHPRGHILNRQSQSGTANVVDVLRRYLQFPFLIESEIDNEKPSSVSSCSDLDSPIPELNDDGSVSFSSLPVEDDSHVVNQIVSVRTSLELEGAEDPPNFSDTDNNSGVEDDDGASSIRSNSSSRKGSGWRKVEHSQMTS